MSKSEAALEAKAQRLRVILKAMSVGRVYATDTACAKPTPVRAVRLYRGQLEVQSAFYGTWFAPVEVMTAAPGNSF